MKKRARRTRCFVLKFQQSTGANNIAKGAGRHRISSTNQLTGALNDVGGEPCTIPSFHPTGSVHQHNIALLIWCRTLILPLPLSTIQNATIGVRAREWLRFLECRNCSAAHYLQRFSARPIATANARSRKRRRPMRMRNICFTRRCLAFGQSNLPVKRAKSATPELFQRIPAYMAKALKEGKLNTSWIQPNEAMGCSRCTTS